MSSSKTDHQPRVLVVDDDIDFSVLLVEVLDSVGIAAQSAANGLVALEQLASGYRPDVIVLDLMMPEMDGREFRRRQRLLPELAAIPVVLLSGDDWVSDEAAGIDADGFVLKPSTLETLLREIERVLDRHRPAG